MDLQVHVNMTEMVVRKAPTELVCLGLGSCIGLVLYDSYKKIGGLAHVVLPHGDENKPQAKPGKYGNLAVKALIEEMLELGARKSLVCAKLFGGANMFPNLNVGKASIGETNFIAVSQMLDFYNIPIVAQEVGGNEGRTIFFETKTGLVRLKTKGTQLRVY